jgi:hypothetical protein
VYARQRAILERDGLLAIPDEYPVGQLSVGDLKAMFLRYPIDLSQGESHGLPIK